jgi:hypothetical protein
VILSAEVGCLRFRSALHPLEVGEVHRPLVKLTMPLIAQLEQEHEQHQQSAQSIAQRLARLRDFQRLIGPRFEIRVTERAPSLHEWAYEVLKEAGQPLHVKAIATRASVLAGRLVTSHQIANALYHHGRDHGEASMYRCIARGIYSLQEYT